MSLRLSGGRRLQSPPGSTARPTAARVRQAVLNLLAGELPGSHWLDLCSGSGVMACEALQRGAARVVAIERDRRIAAVARANLEAVAASRGSTAPTPVVQVVAADALRWLAASRTQDSAAAAQLGEQRTPPIEQAALLGGAALAEGFDLIYLDPPWPAGLHGRLSSAVLRGGWIRPSGTLIWECPSDAVPELPAGWRQRDQRRYGGSTVVLLEPCLEPAQAVTLN